MLMPLLLPFLTACDGVLGDTGEPGDPCEVGMRKEVVIGQGELSFTAIDGESDRLELIYGPQGGYHVVIAARAQYLDAGDFVAAHLSGTIDGDDVGESWPYIDFRCNAAEGSQDGVGMLLIFNRQPEDLHQQTLEISLEVEDLAGDIVSDTRTATIWDLYQVDE